jgi:CRISPR/Cas system CSM-associated protein Csm2 small subunit
MFDIPHDIREMSDIQLRQAYDSIDDKIRYIRFNAEQYENIANNIMSLRNRKDMLYKEMDRRKRNQNTVYIVQGCSKRGHI